MRIHTIVEPRRLAAAVFGLALAGGAGAAASQPADEAAARAALDRLRTGYEQAVAAGDTAALRDMVHPDAVMVPPGGPEWRALMAEAQGGSPFPAGVRMTIRPREVRLLSSEWAYEFGHTTITRPGDAERPAVDLRDTYLVIFRNTGDGWKVFREVASANAPPSPAP